MNHRLLRFASLSTAVALASAPAIAGFTNPYTPAFRGQALTEFAGWESFTVAVGSGNAPTDLASTGDADVAQLTAGAFLTGGNIYSHSSTLSLELADDVAGPLLEVDLQISTWGAELDYGAVRLEYVDGAGQTQSLAATSYTELARYAAVGINVESLFVWDLASVGGAFTNYRITFQGAVPNVSLDALILDTRFGETVTTYCTAKVNSVGCTPAIDFDGAPSATAGSGFDVIARDVLNNKNGLFFYGTNGPNSAPFQGGILCVKAPIKRTAVQGSGGTPPPNNCSGSFSLDFNGFIASGQDANLVAGRLVHGQYWYRDPGFSVPNNTGLTNALAFTILN